LALVWSPPVGLLNACPRLSLITVLGAGVEPLMSTPLAESLPPSIPITRLIDPVAVQRMSNYVLSAALNIALQNNHWMTNQKKEDLEFFNNE